MVQSHRRVGGQVGLVRDLCWKGHEPWRVLQWTLGRRVAVAYGWTDLPPAACPTQMTDPELLPSGLLEMGTYWRGLQAHRPPHRCRTRPQRTERCTTRGAWYPQKPTRPLAPSLPT
jgi:hypothetical protein